MLVLDNVTVAIDNNDKCMAVLTGNLIPSLYGQQ